MTKMLGTFTPEVQGAVPSDRSAGSARALTILATKLCFFPISRRRGLVLDAGQEEDRCRRVCDVLPSRTLPSATQAPHPAHLEAR
jgi:hypothetical protein